MLFETIGQGWIFLFMLYIGILSGLFDEISRLIKLQVLSNKALKKSNKNLSNKSKNLDKSIKFLPQKKSTSTKTKHSKKILKSFTINFIDFFRMLFFGIILYFSIYFLNYGEIRLYLILAFIAGFWLERTILAKGAVLLIKKLYNRRVR